jgi:hypothetical protein
MNEYPLLVKAIENLGTAGFIILALWRLTDRWAAKFLGAQMAQAQAMQSLADAVKESQNDQQEVLVAMRVMARTLDEVKGWVREIAAKCPSAPCRFPGGGGN